MATETITKCAYMRLRAHIDAFDAWVRAQGGSYHTDAIPASMKQHITSNDERSAVEVYEFINTPPERYFAYVTINTDGAPDGIPNYAATTWGMHRVKVGTWTASPLNAGPVSLGQVYKSNFGDKRRSIRFRAINGKVYAGTFYCGVGDYCRIKAVKA